MFLTAFPVFRNLLYLNYSPSANHCIPVIQHQCLTAGDRSLRLIENRRYCIAVLRYGRPLLCVAGADFGFNTHLALYFGYGDKIYISCLYNTAVQPVVI